MNAKHTESMVIIEGRIKMEGNISSFGYPLWNYLRRWQKEKSIPDGTRIRVITDEDYQDLIAKSRMAGIASQNAGGEGPPP